jgi:hypothetical protein
VKSSLVARFSWFSLTTQGRRFEPVTAHTFFAGQSRSFYLERYVTTPARQETIADLRKPFEYSGTWKPADEAPQREGPHSGLLAFARHAGDEFFKLLHERELSPDLSKHEAITLGLCVRALTTFSAIVDMLELSLSLQALAIHRSLFDLMLQARWLNQDPEPRCHRYVDYDTLHRWYYLKYISRWGEIEDPKLRSELAIRLAALCRKYGVIGKGRHRRCVRGRHRRVH